MTTPTKTASAAETLNNLFQSPDADDATPGMPWAVLQVQDTIFTISDVEIISRVGVTTWALRQEPAQWTDRPLNWTALPGLLRTNILTDVMETLGQPAHYVVPFRHVGRVLTFAVLPVSPEPIRVRAFRFSYS